MRLIDELNDLHAAYVEAVNHAVGNDDLASADRLAEEYDAAAVRLVAEREGLTHLLPLQRGPIVDTPLRRLAARLRTTRATRATRAA